MGQLIKQSRPLASRCLRSGEWGAAETGHSIKGSRERAGKAVVSHGEQADQGEGVSGKAEAPFKPRATGGEREQGAGPGRHPWGTFRSGK